MAVCGRCHGDSLAWRRKDKPLGQDMDLRWLCDTCFTGLPSVPAVKRRGLVFYRRILYQIVFPVMGAVFALVEMGLHL